MDLVVLVAVLTAFILVLFWFVNQTIGKTSLSKSSPAISAVAAIISPYILVLVFVWNAFTSGLPQLLDSKNAPNYPESLLWAIGAFWLVFTLNEKIVAITKPLFKSPPLRVCKYIVLFVCTLLAIAHAFPAWFGLTHEPSFIIPVFVGCLIVAKLIAPLVLRSSHPEVSSEKGPEDNDRALERGLSAQVRKLADEGHKLEAVKAHMTEAGISLMNAKKTVEAHLSPTSKDTRP